MSKTLFFAGAWLAPLMLSAVAQAQDEAKFRIANPALTYTRSWIETEDKPAGGAVRKTKRYERDLAVSPYDLELRAALDDLYLYLYPPVSGRGKIALALAIDDHEIGTQVAYRNTRSGSESAKTVSGEINAYARYGLRTDAGLLQFKLQPALIIGETGATAEEGKSNLSGWSGEAEVRLVVALAKNLESTHGLTYKFTSTEEEAKTLAGAKAGTTEVTTTSMRINAATLRLKF